MSGAPTHTLPRVRWPVPAIPGQSLPGLVVATAGHNGHGDMSTIIDFARLGTKKGLGRAMEDEGARRSLAHVLGQAPKLIDEMALRPAAPIGERLAVNLGGARVPAGDVVYNGRRLGDTSVPDFHHKAAWQLLTVPIDIDDGTVLVDRCASCGSRLDWRRVSDARHCTGGKTDLDKIGRSDSGSDEYRCGQMGAGANDRPTRVDDEQLTSLRPLCSLIDPRPELHRPVFERLHNDLRTIDRGAAFYLGLQLGRAFTGLSVTHGPARGGPRSVEPEIATLAAGSAIISGWPTAMSEMVAEQAKQDPEAAMQSIRSIRRMCNGENVWPEHEALIRATMPELIEGRDQHAFRRLVPDMVDGLTAAREMRISCHQMAQLLRTKVLLPTISRGSMRTLGSFPLATIREIGAALEETFESATVVEQTGIPLYGVEQLACEDLLVRCDHPAVTALFDKLRVTRTSYQALTRSLHEAASRLDEASDWVPLRKVLFGVGGRAKPWAAIVGAMLNGSLRFCIANEDRRLVDRIHVARGPVLDAVLSRTFDPLLHPAFPFATTMRRRDAMELLNIDSIRFAAIAHLLPGDTAGPNKSLFIAPTLALARRLIDSRETLWRWGVKPDASRMIEGGLGWDRAEVEKRLTGTGGLC